MGWAGTKGRTMSREGPWTGRDCGQAGTVGRDQAGTLGGEGPWVARTVGSTDHGHGPWAARTVGREGPWAGRDHGQGLWAAGTIGRPYLCHDVYGLRLPVP